MTIQRQNLTCFEKNACYMGLRIYSPDKSSLISQQYINTLNELIVPDHRYTFPSTHSDKKEAKFNQSKCRRAVTCYLSRIKYG